MILLFLTKFVLKMSNILHMNRFCGKHGPINATTKSASLFVTYETTKVIKTKGFRCLVSCVPEDGSASAKLQLQHLKLLENKIKPKATLNCSKCVLYCVYNIQIYFYACLYLI